MFRKRYVVAVAVCVNAASEADAKRLAENACMFLPRMGLETNATGRVDHQIPAMEIEAGIESACSLEDNIRRMLE